MTQNKQNFSYKSLWLKNKKDVDAQQKINDKRELRNRIITSVVLLCFVVLFLFFGISSINLYGFNTFNRTEQIGFGVTYLFLGIFVLAIALFEYFKLFYKYSDQYWIFIFYFLVAALLSYGPTFLYYFDYLGFYHLTFKVITKDFGLIQIIGVFFGAFILYVCQAKNLRHLKAYRILSHYVLFFLISYFFMFFNFLMILHSWTVIFILWVPVIFNDTFAYFGGKKFGKHKLAEKISPNKTWEGVIFGVTSALIIILVLGGFYLLDKSTETNSFGYVIINNNIQGNILSAINIEGTAYAKVWVFFISLFFFGLIIGFLATAGDLIFSFFKRVNDVKDYGKLLVGHGGVLDRIDSLILVVIFFGIFDSISFAVSNTTCPFFPYFPQA